MKTMTFGTYSMKQQIKFANAKNKSAKKIEGYNNSLFIPYCTEVTLGLT